MASIRTLKKDLNYLSYELLTEAFTYKHFHADLPEEKFDQVIRNLVKIRNELLGQINHPGTFANPSDQKHHYHKIHEGMVRLVQVIDELDK